MEYYNEWCIIFLFVAIDEKVELHQLTHFKCRSLTVGIVARVAAIWKIVALCLHFKHHYIDMIERDYSSQLFACLKMFSLWLDGIGCKPKTWRTLITALGQEEQCSTLTEELQNIFADDLSATGYDQATQGSSPTGTVLSTILLVKGTNFVA